MKPIHIFFRRYVAAILIGLLVGLVGVAFHYAVDFVTHLRGAAAWLMLLLPVGGLATVWLYQICGMGKDRGTNLVLVAVREHEPMRLRTAPLIFLATVLNHLVGGSSGREGAALQLGASISSKISHTLKLEEHDGRILTVCGMAAAFSALFGTPLAAAMFALEVVHVGVLQYAALVPALVSSLTGFLLAGALGVTPTFYALTGLPALAPVSMLQVTLLGALCALVSILFCKGMHLSHDLYARFFPDRPYRRAAVGGLLVLGLTLAVGLCHGSPLGYPIYNGAGGELIHTALLAGNAAPWDFLLKILFTAVTLGAGFRGGEIVPTFATGATFGCVAAPLLGLSPSFGGGVGLVALFCGVTNCPLTSILLAYELFGGSSLPLFALAIAVSYHLSGNSSLYSEQRIVYSKHQPTLNDWKAKNLP